MPNGSSRPGQIVYCTFCHACCKNRSYCPYSSLATFSRAMWRRRSSLAMVASLNPSTTFTRLLSCSPCKKQTFSTVSRFQRSQLSERFYLRMSTREHLYSYLCCPEPTACSESLSPSICMGGRLHMTQTHSIKEASYIDNYSALLADESSKLF